MSSVLDKIRRRRCYPVDLEHGETVHVRPLGGWDKLAINSLESPDEQLAYSIGRCLVNEDAERVMDRNADESAKEYIARVRLFTEDLSYADLAALATAISKVTKVPAAETLLKNSEPTITPDS